MKKIILSFILLIGVLSASAQVNYGLKGGFNGSMAGFGSGLGLKPGLYLGAHAEIDIDAKFSIQPEIMYSRQGYRETFGTLLEGYWQAMRMNYIQIPVMVKYYIIPKMSIDVGPQWGIRINVNSITDNGYRKQDPVSVTSEYTLFDLSMCVGLTYNFNDFFAVVGRYNMGLIDTRKEEEVSYHNNVFQIGFDVTF